MASPYPVVDRLRDSRPIRGEHPAHPVPMAHRSTRTIPPPSRPNSPGIAQIPSRPPSPGIPDIKIPVKPPSAHAANITSAPHKRKVQANQHAQVSIDQFWARFTSSVQGKPFTVLPNNEHAQRAARASPRTIGGQNALASYDEAKQACEAKVAKIVKECRRLNMKYRDPHFDIEDDFRKWMGKERAYADCLMGLNEIRDDLRPASVKRVEDIFLKPQFFIDGATANDVRQGKEGDCWFMSSICTLSNKAGLLDTVCVARDEKVGVYGFVFHRDGEWISEIIDDKLYLIKEDFDDSTLERNKWLELQNRTMPADEWRAVMQTGSRALFFAQCQNQNETWLPLLEKAYAKAHGDYSALESGFVGEGIEDLTGGVTTELFSTDILDKEKFWHDELMNVNKEFLFGCGQMNGAYGQRSGIIEKHAYSVMEAREVNGERLVKLRNPWGSGGEWQGAWSDGSAEWTAEWLTLLNHKFGDDGVFWISYSDLLRNYQHFDRTRLFGKEWTVTQQWTSVEVPWTVSYLNTKFKVTIPKAGPVVIVLSQLDDRYFKGLEGQYDFYLKFRLHKDGEDEYIVRSNAAYYMKRSVSTELDLEPGTYWVLLKIEAKRYPEAPTVEDVIAKTCQYRRGKLLQVGLSYDMAHAKGNFHELEARKADRKRRERKQYRIEQSRKKYSARTHVHRVAKLRDFRMSVKRQEKQDRHTARAAAAQREADAATAAERLSAMKIDQPMAVQPTLQDPSLPSKSMTYPLANGTRLRRDTLTVEPPSRPLYGMSSSGVPDIRAPLARAGQITLRDISDDDLSWDEEINLSEEEFDYEPIVPGDMKAHRGNAAGPSCSGCGRKNAAADDDDEFQKDPWNAVCVVGLRVYSERQEVQIEVVREDGSDGFEEDGQAQLDVDDMSKDAVDAGRTPVNSPVSGTQAKAPFSLAEMMLNKA